VASIVTAQVRTVLLIKENREELSIMLETVLPASRSDARLFALVEEAREYAQVYLLAKQRHKGCDGTGELTTLREEFKDVADKIVRYCREKGYLSGPCEYDPDALAAALTKSLL